MISYAIGVRVAQLLFAIVILGLSVSLARGQVIESVPSETVYAAFAGGLGIVAALLGFATTSESSVNKPLTWLVDGVSALALLVGGIIFAVRLRGTRCSNWLTTYHNVLLCGGCDYDASGIRSNCWYGSDQLKSRCGSAIADTVFMFLAFVICIAALVETDARGANRGWRTIWRRQRVELKADQ
ncbi:uncharacterized protein N7529_011957 [Penicillium soppii]|uniref:uncharacterized protein n=1 Tax=Penicillium soppii TaxID=69789 RepID=UPI0025471153|nr:uncharacterized protein N7529_011957 [Penicillium soppii]KAJ5852572.1 hypothetical protein N7529_011957 [Penicillium soppii]